MGVRGSVGYWHIFKVLGSIHVYKLQGAERKLIFSEILAGNNIQIHSRNVKSRNNVIPMILDRLQTIFAVNLEEKITDFQKNFRKISNEKSNFFYRFFQNIFFGPKKFSTPKIDSIWYHVKHIQSRASNSFWRQN